MLNMDTLVIPKPAYNILRRVTGESRPDVALSLALKDLTRLRLEETQAEIAAFEHKYGMIFAAFEGAWKAGNIPEAHSWIIEQDYWAWEATTTDMAALEEVATWMV